MDFRFGENQKITFSHLSCKFHFLVDFGNQHETQNPSKIDDLRSKLGHVEVMLALCWPILDPFSGYVAKLVLCEAMLGILVAFWCRNRSQEGQDRPT